MLLTAHYVLPITAKPLTDGAVLVRDGRICDIGSRDILRLRYPEEEVKDFGLSALMPGFVDLHTHLDNSILRGIVHDVPYNTWLLSVNEQNAKLDSTDWYHSSVLGGLEAISSGITCIADIALSGATIRAVNDLGMRGVIYREVLAMDKRRVDFAMQQAENDIAQWREEYEGSLVNVGVAPGAIYTCHPSIYGKVAEFATRENLPVAMHLAGSREEYNFVKYGSSSFAVDQANVRRGYVEVPPWLPTGTTPVRYVVNWGAFEAPRVLVIHAVHVDDYDVRKFREYGVSIGVCPRCNAQLGMGVAPISEFIHAGLNVGIGTDSPAAIDSTDILSELSIGMLVQRAVNLGEFIDAATMLELATIGGARALGLEDSIGSLDIGKRADIIAVDLASSYQTPTSNVEAAIVNTCSGSDILMTMVDGAMLYEKNKWHVGVEVARNIARVIEIRGKLRL